MLPRALRRLAAMRRGQLIAIIALILAPFATAAQGVGAGEPGPIELTGAWAGPIAGTTPVCTPEPDGRRAYGTDVPFSWDLQRTTPRGVNQLLYSGTAARQATTPNVPSNDDMILDARAGEHTDYCIGFTMTPNLEDGVVSTSVNSFIQRLNDTSPPLTDYAVTHALDGTVGDDLAAARVTLPEGFAAEVDSTPKCTAAEFGVGNYLDAATTPSCGHAIVGTAFARVSTNLLSMSISMGGQQNAVSPKTLFSGGIIYNLEHGPDEFARLGVSIKGATGQAPAKFTVRVVSAADGSGRLEGVVTDAPRAVYSASEIDKTTGQPRASTPANGTTPAVNAARRYEVYVESVGMRIWGAAADHPIPTTDTPTSPKPGLTNDFAQNGTRCGNTERALTAITTYDGTQDQELSQGYELTGCEALDFNPSVTVTNTERKPGVPTAARVRVAVEQSASGPETALLRTASVTLPAGLELGAQVGTRAGGLKLCSAAQFAKTDVAASTCPAGSAVGDVTVNSPLMADPLVGKAYLGEQAAVGELPPLYLEIAPEGASPTGLARVKLIGEVTTSSTGQVTTTITDAPQLRFSDLQIDFAGGSDALFVTPRTCGDATGQSSFTSWASSTPVTRSATITIDQDCDTPGFAPTISMVAQDPRAGASSPTTVTMSRPDRSPWLREIAVALPTGFLANLNEATECGEAAAAAAACPASSRIASVETTAGAGSSPLALSGSMYLVTPSAGSVAGASIVVRAKIGELDLGDVIVPARIDLRPTDAGLTLTTTAPTRFRNLPLMLRSVAVSVDRPNFPVSPTACGPLTASATLGSDQGQTASPSTQISYTGCADLPFAPTLSATLTGATVADNHPELTVAVNARAGDSNLKGTTVVLPAGIGADLANTRNACTQEQWASVACPASTKVGSATARVRITPDVIPGDVYLVTIPGRSLPGLGLNFTGRYAQRILSTVQVVDGRVRTTFDTIPDLPLTSLNLKVDGGARSPLVYLADICNTPSAFVTTFTAQGGQTATAQQAFTCPSNGVATPTARWSRKSGATFGATLTGGQRLQSIKFTLPKGFRFKTRKADVKRYLKVKYTGGGATAKLSKTSLSVVGKAALPPTGVTISVKAKGVTLPGSRKYRTGLKRGTKLKVRVRMVLVGGKVQTSTLTVTVK